jgi:Tfp pilus assembly protein PilV
MTLIEVMIALFLLGVGILALITLQPSAWRLSGKSDYLGRASGVLAAQLQTLEAQVINPNNTLPATGTSTVNVSGQDSLTAHGDVAFTVATNITDITQPGKSPTYRVNVVVTWPGSPTGGIKESVIISQQQSFAGQ